MKKIWIIIFLGLLIYGFGLFNGFVWDDEEQIVNNRLVYSIANFPKFFTGSTFNTGGTNSLGGVYYKPLMTTGFSAIYSLFGPNPFFFHFLSLVFHIGSAILIYSIFLQFFPELIAFFCSLIFLVHPINVETVVYISSLQDVMFLYFGLLSFYLVIKNKFPFLIGAFLLLALLSKETAIGFFFTILAYSLLFNKEKKTLSYTLLSFLLSLFTYFFLRLGVAGIFFQKYELSPVARINFYERLIVMPKIIFYYFKIFFYPINLGISQYWVVKMFDFQNFWWPLLIITGFFLLLILELIYLLKKKNEAAVVYSLFFIWFLLGLGMHLQLIPLDMTVADRWFYFPLVGLLGMIGTVLSRMDSRLHGNDLESSPRRRGSRLLISLGILVIILFSIRSFVRTLDWKNGLTLYSKDIKTVTNSFDLENNFGVELFRIGDFQRAKMHFKTSTKLAPYWWANWNNLGVIYEREKNYRKAAEYYQKSIDNGQYYLAYENLARILVLHGKDQKKTDKFIRKSLEIFPNNENLKKINDFNNQRLNRR